MSLLDSSEGDNSQHELTLLELNNYPNPQMICKLEITTPLDKLPPVLEQLINLTKLTAVSGRISKIEHLQYCEKLRFLNLSSNIISRIENLKNNKQLKCLVLDYNPIACIQIDDLKPLKSLEKLFLSGTKINNLWMTAAALKNAPSLNEVAFCKFDGQYMQNLLDLESIEIYNDDEIEKEEDLETIIDTITGRIGDMTIEEIGGRINNLSDSVSNRINQTDWSRFGTPVIPAISQRIIDIGERIGSQDLIVFGERLNTFSIPTTVGYLRSLKNNISEITGQSASSLASLLTNIQNVVNEDSTDFFLDDQMSDESSDDELDYEEPEQFGEKFSSPICLEKNYTEFFIHHLPRLKRFDGIKISQQFRERASEIYFSRFEDMNWSCPSIQKYSTPHVLMNREYGAAISPYSDRLTTRESNNKLCSSLLSKYEQPHMSIISNRQHAPRQFEYHPTEPNLLVYGTTIGEIFVINTLANRSSEIFLQSLSPAPIFGLAWFNINSNLFIAGSEDGTLNIFNTGIVNGERTQHPTYVRDLPTFPHLTSIHINSTDQYCIASGFNEEVRLYDLNEGRVASSLKDLHKDHINVTKFAHHNPNLFTTSSFDEEIKLWDLRDMRAPLFTRNSTSGNVMACFSPDDRYILSSAVDNEVRQYSTDGGRLHLHLDIKKRYSKYNYTRSYYMNNGECIIVGSCQESTVRVYSAETGRFLRDVLLDYDNSDDIFCQSLRADPFQPYTFTALVASKRDYRPIELTEINLLKRSS